MSDEEYEERRRDREARIESMRAGARQVEEVKLGVGRDKEGGWGTRERERLRKVAICLAEC